jgi:3-deoxy-manno-octulosonate cytidylyltransferase (CMP-KDO synthetase)
MMSHEKHKIIGIIPARYASTRFPGKLLVEICGKPLIQWTYENTRRCRELDALIIATDHPAIYDCVFGFGGVAVMTPDSCATGSDRAACVVAHEPSFQAADAIVNVQGDEPCLDPQAISSLIQALVNDSQAVMSTAITIQDEEEARNPHDVKCVIDLKGNALYFSRSTIPGNLKSPFQKGIYYKHIGIYAYRPDFLLAYPTLAPTPLQLAEDLEQLKVLEHGYRIKTALVNGINVGVNTPEDIKKVECELCKQSSFL